MKKLSLLLAVVLPLLPLNAQEAANAGESLGSLKLITRLDLAPVFSPEGTTMTLGSTLLFTDLMLTPSEHVGIHIVNQWMSYPSLNKDVLKEQTTLYTNLGRSDYLNWLNTLSVNFHFGGWTFALGKSSILVDSYEYNILDYLTHMSLATEFWMNVQPYQWGGAAYYTTPSGKSMFGASARTSPYGERPFASGLFTYGAEWIGRYGWFSNIWQFSAIEKSKGSFEPVVSLGQKATIGDFAIGFDWINRLGDWDLVLIKGNAFTLRGEYDDSNDWKVTATAIYETCATFRSVKAGAVVEYFPLPEGRRDLRLAFSAAYNTHLKTLTTSLGCTYILNHNFKRK